MELLIGFFLSLMIGLTGVGAGILTTPFLILIFNLEPAIAVGTALAFATVIKACTGILYAFNGFYDGKTLILLTVGGIPGVIMGSYLVSYFPFNHNYIMIFIGSIVVLTSILNIYFSLRKRKTLIKLNFTPILPIVSFLIGLEIGFSSVGAGVLVELLLLSFTNLSVPVVIGTSLLYGAFVSLAGSSTHAFLGNINYTLLFGLLFGGVIGAFVASRIINLLPRELLRYTLLTLLTFFGISLIYRGVM